tara:strand:- start:2415 stop:3725 length:1311 start_codon:yes stop_codon:yes gene_type:complete
MSKPFMFIQAPVATRSGYGSHSRDICRALIKMDKFDIKIASLNWGNTPMNALNDQDPNDKMIIDRLFRDNKLEKQPDIGLEIRIPNEYQCVGKYNIGITAGIETTMVSPKWIEGCNRVDLNIVPSFHSKDVFTNTTYTKTDQNTKKAVGELKLEKSMEVLFEGADTNIYKKTDEISTSLHEELSNIEEDFNFLYVGHWLKGEFGHDRKDTGMLIKVFCETFKNIDNPPSLILKTSSAGFSIIERDEILHKIRSVKETVGGSCPNVYFLHGDLTDDEMNGLYNHPKVKAHISLTKGEGFGRPLLEASLSEKPVIASGWSGQLDFLNKEMSVLLPGDLKQVHPSVVWEDVVLKDSKWFYADYNFAAKVMKDLFINYKKYKINAVRQTLENKNKFSLDKMQDVLEKMLDKYIPEFPKEVKLNLPNMQTSKIKLPKLKKG